MMANKNYTNEYLLTVLKKKAIELGRSPTQNEVDADRGMPSCCAFKKRFGSWKGALKQAGLKPHTIRKARLYADDELLSKLAEAAAELGRSPSATDLRRLKGAPRVETYVQRFGSWNAAIGKAGLPITLQGSPLSIDEKVNKQRQAIEILQTFFQKYGRAPRVRDFLHAESHGLSYKTVISYFGDWGKALHAAGLKSTKKTAWWKRGLNYLKGRLDLDGV